MGLPEDQRDQRGYERSKKKWTEEIEPQIETQLKSHEGGFFLGDKFTALDAVLAHTLMWSHTYELTKSSETITAYLERCADRSSARSSYADASTFSANWKPTERPGRVNEILFPAVFASSGL